MKEIQKKESRTVKGDIRSNVKIYTEERKKKQKERDTVLQSEAEELNETDRGGQIEKTRRKNRQVHRWHRCKCIDREDKTEKETGAQMAQM